MIIVKLQGGLGNQMFQYAAAKSMANDNRIYLDTSFFVNNTQSTAHFTARKLELSVFKNLAGRIINNITLNLLNTKNLIGRGLRKILFGNVKYIYQSEKNEDIALDEVKTGTSYLDGYFQNERYFKAIRSQILYDFTFPGVNDNNKEIERQIKSIRSAVSIHVRRGDYLKPAINNFHGLLPLSFYQQAKTVIETKVPGPHYFIFSDDPDWCRAAFAFLGQAYTIVSNPANNTWEDMYLMSLCKHNIIANSSYSWWAAWLNNNTGKIVIAPKTWFVAQPIDIIPAEWLTI